MTRNIRLLYLHNFLTDFWPQWPFFIIYLNDITGSYTAAMSVMAVETLSSAFWDIPTGIFSDRLGRRSTMAIGSPCSALGIACYAFAKGLPMLYLGALLFGLGQCLFSGNTSALLYESLQMIGRENEFHHYRGKTGSMYQLALCSSGFLAMVLEPLGLRTIFMVAILPQVLGCAVSLFFQEPPRHTRTAHGWQVLVQACIKTWKNPHLMKLVIARAISYGGGESKFKFQTAYLNTLWPTWAMGLYRGLNHGLSFFAFRLSGKWIERFGSGRIFVFRDAYWFVSQIIGISLNDIATPLFYISGAIFFGPGEVASDHLMQQEFSNDERATMGSIASFASSIAFAFFALALGFVSDQWGVMAGVCVGLTFTVLALPINVHIFRKEIWPSSGQ